MVWADTSLFFGYATTPAGSEFGALYNNYSEIAQQSSGTPSGQWFPCFELGGYYGNLYYQTGQTLTTFGNTVAYIPENKDELKFLLVTLTYLENWGVPANIYTTVGSLEVLSKRPGANKYESQVFLTGYRDISPSSLQAGFQPVNIYFRNNPPSQSTWVRLYAVSLFYYVGD